MIDGVTCLYLAGPMSGLPDHGLPAFREAARVLRLRGYTIVSPVELDEADGFDPETEVTSGDPVWAGFLARDLRVVTDERVHAVVVLPDWHLSRGARLEVHVARELGKPILRFPDMAPVPASWLDAAHGAVPASGEVRVTNSTTGGEKGQKPQRMDLIPWSAVMDVSEVYAFGATKYADHNWRRGYAWSLSYGALLRHLAAWIDGEDRDPESGLSHVAHAGFHCLALLTFARECPDLDDRFSPRA
jgi:hypothetical protein